MIRKLLALTCLSLSVCVNAALVDNITYVTDTVTGMDYLKLSQTDGYNYREVVGLDVTGHTSQGWTLTSQHDLLSLTTESPNLAYDLINDIGRDRVITNNDIGFWDHWTANAWNIDQIQQDPNSEYNHVYSDRWNHYAWSGIKSFYISAYPVCSSKMDGWMYPEWEAQWCKSYTVSLSRPSVVPIPAAGWLFMSALIGLIGKKRLSRR